MTEDMWWFGFREIAMSKIPGQIVICGPFISNEEAKLDRDKTKASDCDVSAPFPAHSKEEAKERVNYFF